MDTTTISVDPTTADSRAVTMRACAQRLLCCWSPLRRLSIREYWCSISILILSQFVLCVLVDRAEPFVLAAAGSLRTWILAGEEALLLAGLVKVLIWRYRDAGVSLWLLFGQCLAFAASAATVVVTGITLVRMAFTTLFGGSTSGGGDVFALFVLGGFAALAVLISIGVSAQLPTAGTARRIRSRRHRFG
jgi:hypothetical protein